MRTKKVMHERWIGPTPHGHWQQFAAECVTWEAPEARADVLLKRVVLTCRAAPTTGRSTKRGCGGRVYQKSKIVDVDRVFSKSCTPYALGPRLWLAWHRRLRVPRCRLRVDWAGGEFISSLAALLAVCCALLCWPVSVLQSARSSMVASRSPQCGLWTRSVLEMQGRRSRRVAAVVTAERVEHGRRGESARNSGMGLHGARAFRPSTTRPFTPQRARANHDCTCRCAVCCAAAKVLAHSRREALHRCP